MPSIYITLTAQGLDEEKIPFLEYIIKDSLKYPVYFDHRINPFSLNYLDRNYFEVWFGETGKVVKHIYSSPETFTESGINEEVKRLIDVTNKYFAKKKIK